MNPQDIFCPNIACPARGQIGKGNIGVQSQKDERYIFAALGQRKGTTEVGSLAEYRHRSGRQAAPGWTVEYYQVHCSEQ